MENQTEKTPPYSYYALSLLMFVYVMNFLDRQIIYILFPSIKAELHFTDLQLALLGGTSFAIFYTLLGIPFGRLADRGSRTKLIAFGLATWSLFSGLTGFADSFWTIFACRVMVGVGEATLGPAAISLLADYFPPGKRATVTSIYSMGIAVGAGFAAIFGGLLSQIGWREAFFIVGFPGLLFAVLVFFLREPKRTAAQTTTTELATGDWRKLISNRAFIWLCLGYSLLGLAANNISIWAPTYLSRVYQIPIPKIGYWLGIMMLVAGIPATLIGGAIADRFKRKMPGGRMYFGAFLAAISAVLWVIVLSTDNFNLLIPVGLIMFFAALAWLGAAAADATEIAGSNLRGLAVAIYFFTVNIFAYIIGANLIGKLNDVFGATADPRMMRYALIVGPAACVLSFICLFLGGKRLDKDAAAHE
ncbi:MAG: MFS transporter [Pyrinomonadaceae bacterium]|nr:MFS transporter [Pyrinomonadaceae bacterium]